MRTTRRTRRAAIFQSNLSSTLVAHATSGAPMVMVASVSAPASCAAGARAAKGLAASSRGTACTATDETRAGCTATKAELLPKHSAATAARYIVYESEQFVDLLDEDASTLIEAKRLETTVLSLASGLRRDSDVSSSKAF